MGVDNARGRRGFRWFIFNGGGLSSYNLRVLSRGFKDLMGWDECYFLNRGGELS